ncbi:MAG: Gfo/Idh/MocA family oxidoreductase [Planctomycetes bacterium]|nr:Gfo/Idh/MocA family oxidoreductase [Planctomycetota bacterium]
MMPKENCKRAIDHITRRRFVAGAAGALALPVFAPASALGADGKTPASDRITVGLIGKGVMGAGHLNRLVGDKGIRVLGVCDVDRLRCEQALQRVKDVYGADHGCTMYNDYRELIARKDIDAVVIVTPDHWHTLQTIDAVKAGKDVYCEKPISITVRQGRELVKAVRRYGRIFQTGTQYRSIPRICRVVEFVRGGGLGKVKQVFTLWTSLGGFIGAGRFKPYAEVMNVARYGKSYVPLNFALPAEPVPEGLDWDLWVGPAPWHSYNRLYHTNPTPGVVPWSFCEDFGSASVTWHHSHSADVIQYALGMEESGPVEFIHPSTGEFPTLTCKYANGTLLHLVDHWGMVKDVYKAVPKTARLAGNFGGVFVGEKGWITSMTTGGDIEGEPAGIFEQMKLKTQHINPSNHHANWFECIRSRQKPSCSEEIGHRGASLGHLTIIAYKLGRSLKWDPIKEEFLNDAAANRLRSRGMRAPWRI